MFLTEGVFLRFPFLLPRLYYLELYRTVTVINCSMNALGTFWATSFRADHKWFSIETVSQCINIMHSGTTWCINSSWYLCYPIIEKYTRELVDINGLLTNNSSITSFSAIRQNTKQFDLMIHIRNTSNNSKHFFNGNWNPSAMKLIRSVRRSIVDSRLIYNL